MDPRKALVVGAALAVTLPGVASGQAPRRPVGELWHPLIYFKAGSTEIPEHGHTHLRRVVAYAAEHPVEDLVIRAHADSSGPAGENMKLSMRRAQAVVDQLLSMGLSPARITVQAFGETASPVPTADGVPEPLNRLVVIDWRPLTEAR